LTARHQQAVVEEFVSLIQGRLKLPQGLAQVLLRLVGGIVGPEQTGQDFTRLWMIAMEQKIAQQLLYLSSIEATQSMAVALNGKLAE
jgi:hypothetical protein